MQDKSINHKAWLLVVPVVLVVAFSAILPLMTVVNYSVQDIFGPDNKVFVGSEWFRYVLEDERLHSALWRQCVFSLSVLIIEVPLGIGIALCMPRQGPWVSLVLVLLALPLLVPFNVVGTIWQIFGQIMNITIKRKFL